MGIFSRKGNPPDRSYDPNRLGVRPEVHENAAAGFRAAAMHPGVSLTSGADDLLRTAQQHEDIAARLRGG